MIKQRKIKQISNGSCETCTIDEAETTSGTCSQCQEGEFQDPNDKTKCKPRTTEAKVTTPIDLCLEVYLFITYYC